jgi:hypothetical protein
MSSRAASSTLLTLRFVCAAKGRSPTLAAEPGFNPLFLQLPGVALLHRKPGLTFARTFARVFSATIRDLSAMTMQLSPGKGLKTNKRNSGI